MCIWFVCLIEGISTDRSMHAYLINGWHDLGWIQAKHSSYLKIKDRRLPSYLFSDPMTKTLIFSMASRGIEQNNNGCRNKTHLPYGSLELNSIKAIDWLKPCL